MTSRVTLTFFQIYRWPILIAALIIVGLFAALFGENAVRVFSWFAMAVPLIVLIGCLAASPANSKE